jgi:tetratricopeptide (TPR) repeat protein
MGDLDGAIAKYREAIEVKPDFYQSMKNIAYIFGVQGEYDSALVWMNRYLESVPTPGLQMAGLMWRSLLFFQTGRTGEAFEDLAEWEDSQRSHPRYRTTVQRYFTGSYCLETGRYAVAEQAIGEWGAILEKYMQQFPKRNEGWVRLNSGLIDIRAGRIAEAEAELMKLESLSDGIREEIPKGFEYFQNVYAFLKGELLLAQGRVDEAIAFMRAGPTTEKPPMLDFDLLMHNMPFNRDLIARAYLAKGNLEEAAAEYERLIEFDPASSDRRLRNPRYRYRLAKVYEEMGRRDDAIVQYERFLEIWKHADPDMPEYVDAKKRLGVLKKGK